jgi:hypothetical protein
MARAATTRNAAVRVTLVLCLMQREEFLGSLVLPTALSAPVPVYAWLGLSSPEMPLRETRLITTDHFETGQDSTGVDDGSPCIH